MIISIQKQCTEISIAHRAVRWVVVQAKECMGSQDPSFWVRLPQTEEPPPR